MRSTLGPGPKKVLNEKFKKKNRRRREGKIVVKTANINGTDVIEERDTYIRVANTILLVAIASSLNSEYMAHSLGIIFKKNLYGTVT